MQFRPESLRNIVKRLPLLILAAAIAAWFIVKPVRVIAPALAGVSCPQASVCIDDPGQLQSAVSLRDEALAFVASQIQPIQGQPRIIFCSTDACANAFGLGKRSAVTLGYFGTVIGPRAWKDYYVRHEMIHYLQVERLCTLATLLKPSWFVEGMAYGLSRYPRTPLAQPFEGYRSRFMAWYAGVGPARLWQVARGL